MDPISLIVAALAAGATAGLTDATSEAVGNASGRLTALLKAKGAEPAPGASEEETRRRLADAGAGEDEAVVAAAGRVLRLADPEGHRHGRYTVTGTRDTPGAPAP
ncbi:hypothetical protein [Streptomyces specialis]|uniref:hypothetical protein n=1 Tax=Streptomyces specialis TaxID=498367 RepID=UPI00131D6123|nr:hypothetical protein [Streptomyces specialis]